MRLQIENFAKIKKADITIDGITVIAGENNSGKSTVGKILFSLFNAISDIEEKILNQRRHEIQEVCRNKIRNYVAHNSSGFGYFIYGRKITNDVIKQLNEGAGDSGKLKEIVNSIFANEKELLGTEEEKQSYIDDLVNRITEIINISDYKLMLEVLTRYFNTVFNNQINSLVDLETKASVNLTIKNSKICMDFYENNCFNLDKGIEIMNKAIYIDNPFIIDRLSQLSSKMEYYDEIENFLIDLLRNHSKGNVMEGIIGSMLAKEKLEDVYKSLSSVVPGKIIEKQENEYFLEQNELEKPISFSSLSTGMKSFLIIKMLLEKGCIEEKDVLVLDEPEIHLHPQWQVAYAEVIVLLQKYFELSIVITTHSPYFLDAINIFSTKYGTNEKTKFYLTFDEHQWVRMEDVTDKIELIYQRMANPIQMLDSLRYELNN